MKTVLLTLPDDPALLPSWLEEQLVGEGLRALVSDLSAVHGNRSISRPTLERVLGDQLGAVRQSGLSVLSGEPLRALLRHPVLLWDLQEDLLIHGGEYSQQRFSEHKPLAPEDQKWLIEKCQAWAGKLDAHLVALEAGAGVSEVRDAADEMVRKLITALRERAAAIG